MDGQFVRVDRVLKEVWGMIPADDAGVVSQPPEGLTTMMTAIEVVFEAAGLTVPEKNRNPCCFGHHSRNPDRSH